MMSLRSPNAEEEKRKLNAAETLELDRVRLLLDQPFIGAVLIRLNLIPVVDFRCPTASTDGQNIFVNPDFYLKMPPGERRFLLAHEVWHIVYLHFLRGKGRERDIFNMAADMEINFMLKQEKFNVPSSALLPPPKWQRFNAEELYYRLRKENSASAPAVFDVHLEPGRDDRPSGDENGDDELLVMDPDYQVDFGSDPENSVREKVVEAAVQYEKKRGSLPCGLQRIVDRFHSGKLHWKELLAQYVTSCFGGSRRWLPPNRRYISSGLYLQSRRDARIQAILAIDTSGSTVGDFPLFAGELMNLLNSFGQYELTVICCDAKIQSVETFSPENPFDGKRIKFKGCGGTSFRPVFDYVDKNLADVQILIYFTDGFGDDPKKPPYPVMWVITPNGENRIPWGYEVKMEK